MSKLVSVKLDDEVFRDAEKLVRETKTSRNALINRAVRLLTRLYRKRHLREVLKRESARVRRESLAVLNEFEGLLDKDL